jgi:hypothetical protein
MGPLKLAPVVVKAGKGSGISPPYFGAERPGLLPAQIGKWQTGKTAVFFIGHSGLFDIVSIRGYIKVVFYPRSVPRSAAGAFSCIHNFLLMSSRH